MYFLCAPSPVILMTTRTSYFCEVFSKNIELKFNGILLSLMIPRQKHRQVISETGNNLRIYTRNNLELSMP